MFCPRKCLTAWMFNFSCPPLFLTIMNFIFEWTRKREYSDA
jgi:hypothetical protein